MNMGIDHFEPLPKIIRKNEGPPLKSSQESRRSAFLSRVEAIVNSDRNATHGSAEDNFTRIALLWSAYLDTEISRRDVAWMMVLFKSARAAANPKHEDNAIDAAGYLACLAGLEP